MFVYDEQSGVICNFDNATRISVLENALVFEYENYKGNCIHLASPEVATKVMNSIVGSYNLRAAKDFIYIIPAEPDEEDYFYVNEELAAYICDELCRHTLPFGCAECETCKIKVK